jgi:multidrug resistance efflux pump
MLVLLILLVLLAGILAAGSLIQMRRYVRAAGYVTTEEYAEVRPAQEGAVAEILVTSGTRVEKGDVLVKLDATAEIATADEARSRVHQTEADIARRQAEIAERKRTLQEQIAMAKLRLQNVTTKLVRTQELLAKGLVAASALEDDRLKEEISRAELTSLLSRDESIYEKELAVLAQELQARNEAVNRAETRVRAREIRAPIAGQVLRYEFVIGELVRPDHVLYEIFGGDKKVLKLRVGERYATRIATGQPYEAKLASYRGVIKDIEFYGEVQYLRNVIQTEGQQTYRVAYCSFDDQGLTVPPGTTAEAKIFYGRSCLFLYLVGLD